MGGWRLDVLGRSGAAAGDTGFPRDLDALPDVPSKIHTRPFWHELVRRCLYRRSCSAGGTRARAGRVVASGRGLRFTRVFAGIVRHGQQKRAGRLSRAQAARDRANLIRSGRPRRRAAWRLLARCRRLRCQDGCAHHEHEYCNTCGSIHLLSSAVGPAFAGLHEAGHGAGEWTRDMGTGTGARYGKKDSGTAIPRPVSRLETR
jgi:hypothetical protein